MAGDAMIPYRAVAHNNLWANHRLWRLVPCSRTPNSQLRESVSSRALNHILIVDRFYVDAMEGGKLGPAAWSDPEPCKT